MAVQAPSSTPTGARPHGVPVKFPTLKHFQFLEVTNGETEKARGVGGNTLFPFSCDRDGKEMGEVRSHRLGRSAQEWQPAL